MDSMKALDSQKENTLPSECGTVSSVSSKPMPNISFGGVFHFTVNSNFYQLVVWSFL